MKHQNTNTTKKRQHKPHVMVPLSEEARLKVESLAEKEQRSMAFICRQFIEQGLNGSRKKPVASKGVKQ